MGLPVNERIRLTKLKYPTLKELKLAVLKGQYNSDLPYFSRGFLWKRKTVCLNSFKIEFKEDELEPVPREDDIPIESIHHSKHDLEKGAAVSDPLNDQAEDNDILDVIKLDVERLFIDPLFEDAQVQQDIIQILFNYNKFNAYKQGFHEICGLVYLELYNDDHDNSNIKIETFNIFTSLMLSVVPNFYIEQSLIGWCISQFNRYLALVDESLYELLIKRHKIESQIWLIRWVRLLFMRELGIPNTLKILDYLICYDHDLSKLMPFIIIILLIKIKIRLVVCEDNVLQLLLHYPSTEFTHSEVKEIVDLSIKMYRVPEKDLPRCGLELNKRFIKEYNWDKLQDLDRLRMELKLQRGVRRALKR